MTCWRVIVSPSPFRPSFVLGEFRWGLHAWLAAFWQCVVNPCAEAVVQRRRP